MVCEMMWLFSAQPPFCWGHHQSHGMLDACVGDSRAAARSVAGMTRRSPGRRRSRSQTASLTHANILPPPPPPLPPFRYSPGPSAISTNLAQSCSAADVAPRHAPTRAPAPLSAPPIDTLISSPALMRRQSHPARLATLYSTSVGVDSPSPSRYLSTTNSNRRHTITAKTSFSPGLDAFPGAPGTRISSYLSSPTAPSLAVLANHYAHGNGHQPLSRPAASRCCSSAALQVSEAVKSFRLLEALRNGDFKALKPFLETSSAAQQNGASSARDAPVKELTSPLHLAVRCAEFNTIDFILKQHGLDINATEVQGGNTPLHIASSIGRTDVVDLFLSHSGINDTIRNAEGHDAMDVAQVIDIIKLFQSRFRKYDTVLLCSMSSLCVSPHLLSSSLSGPAQLQVSRSFRALGTGPTRDQRRDESVLESGSDQCG